MNPTGTKEYYGRKFKVYSRQDFESNNRKCPKCGGDCDIDSNIPLYLRSPKITEKGDNQTKVEDKFAALRRNPQKQDKPVSMEQSAKESNIVTGQIQNTVEDLNDTIEGLKAKQKSIEQELERCIAARKQITGESPEQHSEQHKSDVINISSGINKQRT